MGTAHSAPAGGGYAFPIQRYAHVPQTAHHGLRAAHTHPGQFRHPAAKHRRRCQSIAQQVQPRHIPQAQLHAGNHGNGQGRVPQAVAALEGVVVGHGHHRDAHGNSFLHQQRGRQNAIAEGGVRVKVRPCHRHRCGSKYPPAARACQAQGRAARALPAPPEWQRRGGACHRPPPRAPRRFPSGPQTPRG